MANRDDLPEEEFVTKILLPLPVKSLLVCKSVCKTWLSTISNPNFIKLQLHQAIVASRNHPTLLNIINYKFLFGTATTKNKQRHQQLINQALLDTESQDLSTTPVHFDRIVMQVMPDFLDCCRVNGCYNGIICLSQNYHGEAFFCLWNPSIRQIKKVPFPSPHIRKYYNAWDSIMLTLFGCDYICNDYKVVRILYESLNSFVPVVQVYSSNADCFNEFHAPILEKLMVKMVIMQVGVAADNPTFKALTNVAVNGVLYFDGGDELVSFDLHEEVFELVPFPSSVQRKRSDVLDFEGSLAMVFESGPGFDVDLWTLDHVSGKLSWTKKFSFDSGFDDSETEIWLSCYLGAGQFYGTKFLDGNCFLYEILYDYEKKKETICYGLRECASGFYIPSHSTFKYTETLVTLDGFQQVENVKKETLWSR